MRTGWTMLCSSDIIEWDFIGGQGDKSR